MSWDILVLRFSPEFAHPKDIPTGWKPPPMGTVVEVRQKTQTVLPGIRADTYGDLVYDGLGFGLPASIDADEMSDKGQVTSVSLHLHGGGAATGAALAICDALRARDRDRKRRIPTPETAADSFAEWQRYRDFVRAESSGGG